MAQQDDDEKIKLELWYWDANYPGNPLQLGLKVKVNPDNEFASEWNEEYVITGICIDEHNRINITIADNLTESGSDGWRTSDLSAVI